MKLLLSLFFLLFALSACDFENPKIKGFQNVRIANASLSSLQIEGDLLIHNPNATGLTLKSAELGFFLEDEKLGDLLLKKSIHIKAKQDVAVAFEYIAPLSKLLKNKSLINQLITLNAKGKLACKGSLKVTKFLFPRKYEVDYSKDISLAL